MRLLFSVFSVVAIVCGISAVIAFGYLYWSVGMTLSQMDLCTFQQTYIHTWFVLSMSLLFISFVAGWIPDLPSVLEHPTANAVLNFVAWAGIFAIISVPFVEFLILMFSIEEPFYLIYLRTWAAGNTGLLVTAYNKYVSPSS